MLDWSETEDSCASSASDTLNKRGAPSPLFVFAKSAPQTGLGDIDRNGARVSVDQKRMINCRADVNRRPLRSRF
jgi:ribonucleoside-diphosphate reductase beta chain